MAALKTYKPQPKVTNHKVVIEAALGRLDHVNGDNSIRWAQSVILGLQAAETLQNDRQMMELWNSQGLSGVWKPANFVGPGTGELVWRPSH